MFSSSFDLVLAVILLGLAVIFFLGKGGGILNAFKDNTSRDKRRTEEEERAFQRAIGIFLLPLAAGELICALYRHPVSGLIMIVIAIADLVVFGIVTRKK